MKYALEIAYLGTNFHGWQIQNNAVSVQGCVNEALSQILRHPISSLGSGRTDTGVHAKQQWVQFETDQPLSTSHHLIRFNSRLPEGIAILGIYEMPQNGNVRFDAIERCYHYHICQRADPFEKNRAAILLSDLNLDAMNRGAEYLLLQKDFKSFAKSSPDVNNFLCDVRAARWTEQGHSLTFEIRANRFLRNMVRSIVGTLVEIGLGKLKVEDLEGIFVAKKRSKAGKSMSAEGLYLMEVKYPEGYFIKI